MKKILFLIISLFSFITSTYAFDIDVDKIDINAKDNDVINNLNSSYKVNASDFVSKVSKNNDVEDITKELVSISLSDDKDNKLANLTKYLYYADGTTTLTGGLFLTDFVNKINENSYSYEYVKNIRTVSLDEGILVFAYLDDIKVNDEVKDMVISYWLYDTDDGYKVHFAWFTFDSDLEDYYNQVSKNETSKNVISGAYKSSGINISNDVNDEELNNIYNNNVSSNVSITGMKDNGIDNYGSGFFLRSGVIVTSWELFLKMLNNNDFIYVNDYIGNTYNVDGVIAADTNYDIVVLKLNKDEGTKVTLGDSNSLNSNDNIFMINSIDNSGFSIKYGRFLELDNDKLKNLMAINSSSIGACLYNSNGEVIGFNTGISLDNELSIANSSNYLNDIYKLLNNTSFNKISYTSIDDFMTNYYNRYDSEKEFNNIPDNIWEIYSKIGNIKDNINLDLIKGSYDNGVVSLRYRNDISDSISSMYLVSTFENELINDGYKLIVDNSNRKVYKNNNYKIVIKSNMNYLIIIMMEL